MTDTKQQNNPAETSKADAPKAESKGKQVKVRMRGGSYKREAGEVITVAESVAESLFAGRHADPVK